MPETVVICGGGIIGCATAYYLKKLDPQIEVTVIEAVSIASQASGKAGGFLAKTWNSHDDNLDKLTKLSFDLHRQLRDELEVDVGYRNLNTYSANFSHSKCCSLPEKSKNPNWIYSSKSELIGTPNETAQVHPKLLTTALIEKAKAKGAKVLVSKVQGLEFDINDKVLGVKVGQDEVILADHVVLALGPWTQFIDSWFPEKSRFSFRRNFHSERAHSVVFDAHVPAEALFMCFGDEEIEVYPRPDETVYSCGFGDKEPLPVDPTDVAACQRKCYNLSSACREICPALKNASLRVDGQACYLPFSADTKPVIGPLVGDDSGLYVASGHGVWGILNAPATGLCLASNILGKPLPRSAKNAFSAFAISRFLK